MTDYRKPNGKYTTSVVAYVKAWRKEIILPLEKHFDVVVMTYDPGVSMRKNVPLSMPVTIPLWLAQRMVQLAKLHAV